MSKKKLKTKVPQKNLIMPSYGPIPLFKEPFNIQPLCGPGGVGNFSLLNCKRVWLPAMPRTGYTVGPEVIMSPRKAATDMRGEDYSESGPLCANGLQGGVPLPHDMAA